MSKKQPVRPVGNKPKTSNQNLESSLKLDSGLSNKILIPAAILLFIVLGFIYFKPLMEGMQFSTHDSNQYMAMNKEVADFKASTGHTTLWASRMFGGMPTYMLGGLELPSILTYAPTVLLVKVLRLLPSPLYEVFNIFIWAFLSFFFISKRKIWLSLLGALAVSFSTANFISLSAGHMTKVTAIGYVIPYITGAYLIYSRKFILGSVLYMTFLFLEIGSGHIQITYYSLILFGILFLYGAFLLIREKEYNHLLKCTGLIIALTAIVGLMNFQNYFINDFAKETTRGGDILHFTSAEKKADAKDANDKGVGFDYATRWSLGYEELGAMLVPDFVGGSSSASLDEKSNTYAVLSSKGVPPDQASQFVSRLPLYWGSEPFVQGPIYLGVIVIFLFVFGMFAYKSRFKWYLLGVIIFTILIALGKNFETFYRLLYNFVPVFNKFRAPTMILALTQIIMIIIGILGLADFFDTKTTSEERMKTLKYSGAIVAGLLVVFLLLGSTLFSFQSTGAESTDTQFKSQLTEMIGDQTFANDIFSSLVKDRKAQMQGDAFRSLIFVLLAIGLLFTYIKGYLKNASIITAALALLVLVDFWQIDKRYLNDRVFVPKTDLETNVFPLTPADQAILADNKDGARMIDISGDVFNSASPAYHHRTIGGYNPAKLRRYQDIIEYGLSYDLGENAKNGLPSAHYMNMLNTRYIKNGNETNNIIPNPFASGNAWFVQSLQVVNTNEDEIMKVRDINPATTALVNKEFEKYISSFTPNADSVVSESRNIRLTDAKDPSKLEYTFRSPKDEFVVFSEVIYRPNVDWVSYIDGKQADHIRVNYILRGMKVPAGDHKITFEFKPKLYATTNAVISAGYLLFYLVIALAVFAYFRHRKQSRAVTNE